MSPRDDIPELRGLDGEGSVQVHQDETARIEGAMVFSVYGKGDWQIDHQFQPVRCIRIHGQAGFANWLRPQA